MIETGAGDLITIPPGSALYPTAYSSPAAPTTTDHTLALVVSTHDYYLNVILPSGRLSWIHRNSCRLARKADRT